MNAHTYYAILTQIVICHQCNVLILCAQTTYFKDCPTQARQTAVSKSMANDRGKQEMTLFIFSPIITTRCSPLMSGPCPLAGRRDPTTTTARSLSPFQTSVVTWNRDRWLVGFQFVSKQTTLTEISCTQNTAELNTHKCGQLVCVCVCACVRWANRRIREEFCELVSEYI